MNDNLIAFRATAATTGLKNVVSKKSGRRKSSDKSFDSGEQMRMILNRGNEYDKYFYSKGGKGRGRSKDLRNYTIQNS